MRISLNWLKKYVNIKISDEELIRLIGARLVEIEGVIDETHKYDNICIVRVEQAEKIPETHLTLCQVNDGSSELVQVICGADNVREGMLAAWIKPGAIVPASVHEDAPFVIGKRKMLNKYDSNGMLAGADELDFGDDHSGIVEINPEIAKPGDLLADVFELKDLILEIENKSLTHRPDCFGIIGFAREVAGILGQSFGDCELPFLDGHPRARSFSQHFAQSLSRSSRQLVRPEASLGDFTRLGRGKVDKNDFGSAGGLSKKGSIAISIASPEICSRYTAIVLKKHGEMKKKYLTWGDTVLAKSGMKPISPIVDATNYLMLLTGQPLHAFDYDKFVAVGKAGEPKITVRLAKKGEKLVLLDDEEVSLNENDIVITSNDVPVALAGAMGGKSTMIDEDTKNIILESATFSLYNLRKTQMAHGIFSEAITRFTKGQPTCQTLEVAKMCAKMLKDGFEVAAMADEYPKPEKEVYILISVEDINKLLGTSYDEKLVIKTLENVGFKVEKKKSGLIIEAPMWRTDIHIKEDIIEEVGRLLGYDNITPTLPLHATAEKNEMFELKKNIRGLLSRLGANEVLTYSFISGRLLKKVGQEEKNSYKIINSISPELQFVRQSLMPNLLEKAYLNQKIPVDKFAIFEMNKVYQKEWGFDSENVPKEKLKLSFLIAERKNSNTAYYAAKKYVDTLLKWFGLGVEYRSLKSKDSEAQLFEPKRSAEIVTLEGECLGTVGEFKNSVKQEFKLGDYLAGFEIDLELLLKNKSDHLKIDLDKKEARDLTIITTESYASVINKVKRKLAEKNIDAEISPLMIYQPNDSTEKHISLHLEFRNFDAKIMEELENL